MREYWILIIGFALLLPGALNVSSQELDQEILEDETGDVVSEEYIEETVSGYDDIDITGMSIEEGLTEVTVTFTVKGTINLDEDYNYEFSAGDLDFEIWDGEVDISPSSADYTIVGGVITVTIPRDDMDLGWIFMYGSASYFDMTGSGVYVQDSIQDIRTRAGISKELTDPEGDVTQMRYEETLVSDKPYLDIVKVTVTELENGDYIVVLELAAEVSESSMVSYSIDMDDAYISYNGGSGHVNYYDGEDPNDEVEASGKEISATLNGSMISSIDYIYASASEDNWETGESTSDMVSNDPWDDLNIDDLEDLDMEMLLEIDLLEEDKVEIRLTYRIGDGIFSDLMREDFDEDEDGQITQDEIETFFDDPDESGEEIIDVMSVEIDGKEGTSTTAMEYSGIVGPVDSDDDIEVVMKITFQFDLDDADTHDVEVIIDESDSYEEEYEYEEYAYEDDYEESSLFGDYFFNITFRVILPDGWGIVTDSLEPAFFLDFLNNDNNLIQASGEDLEDMEEPDDALISFTMEHDDDKYVRADVSDDDDDGNDSPIPGAFILSAALLITCGIGILGSRRRK